MSGNVKLSCPAGGSVTISAADTASNLTATIPAATDTLVNLASTQTLTNKTLTAAGSNSVEATSGPTSTQLSGNRNKIINGAMMIDQRNAGASVNAGNAYTLDRYQALTSGGAAYSVQQNAGSVTPPTGFKNYFGVTSLGAYSIVSGSFFFIRQFIEGYNIADLAWGTASAASVTVSFWVRSSLTGTFGGSLVNGGGTRCYPFTYAINSANTWEYKTVTIAGDQSGTWATDNTAGIQVNFGLGCGSSNAGSAGSWQAAGYFSATGATSVVGTNGATFYITGVQLEKGATATPFENRLYGTELALCQRYFWNMNNGAQLYYRFPVGFNSSTTQGNIGGIKFPASMRANPSFSYSGTQYSEMVTGATGTSLTLAPDGCSNDTGAFYTTYTSGTVSTNNVGGIRIINNTSWYLNWSAEL